MVENKAIGKFIAAFVMVLLGAVLIGVIANQTNSVTSTIGTTDTSFSLASARTTDASDSINASIAASNYTIANQRTAGAWKTTDCPLTNFVFKNGTSADTALVLDTDYNINLNQGYLHVLNTTHTQGSQTNATYISYTYCQDSYVNSSFGRTAINLIAGFFAIALLLVGVGLFYSVGKETGIV